MRGLLSGAVLLLLVACAAPQPMGPWPDTAYNRKELERVKQGGRIVVIEQVPRFLTAGKGGGALLNQDSSFDQYLFWDWCRGGGHAWQMVTLRPDARAGSGWGYTLTKVIPGRDGYSGTTETTEGKLRGTVADYQALRAAGLAFFEVTQLRCDPATADWATGA